MAEDRLDRLINSPSAFEFFLTWFGRPGYAVRDLLTGNVEGAGRQLADFALDPIDAAVPFVDLIPEISRKQDYVEGSDLIGVQEPGIGKIAADIGIGMLTDPLTYLSFGTTGLLSQGAKAGLKAAGGTLAKLPGGAAAVSKIGEAARQVRRTAGALKPTDDAARMLDESKALEDATSKSAMEYAGRAFQGVDQKVMANTHDILNDVIRNPTTGAWETLGVGGAKVGSKADQMALIDSRLAMAKAKYGWDDAMVKSVRDVSERTVDYTRGLYKQAVGDRVMQAAGKSVDDVPLDYIPRHYDIFDDAAKFDEARKLVTSEGYAGYLNKLKQMSGKDSVVATDLPQILGKYGQQLGRKTRQAKLGNELLKTVGDLHGGTLNEEGFKAAVKKVIEQVPDADTKELLDVAFAGALPQRGAFMGLLAKVNNDLFKRFATAGAFIPRIAFTTSNMIGGAWSTLANAEARGALIPTLRDFVPRFVSSIGDGLKQLGITWLPESRLDRITKAVMASGGKRDAFLSSLTKLDDGLADAVKHGVLDNTFVSTEQMVTDLAKAGNWRSLRNWRDWPQAIARGGEQRMRLSLFESLKGQGKSSSEAARIVRDTLFDYDVQTTANRAARDVIPFFQFSAKAIPQTLQFILEKPVVAAALRPLYVQDQGPVYPYMEGQANIPLGRAPTGEQTYLSSLRMPFESLSIIPNLSDDPFTALRQTKQGIVGSLQPLLKTGVAALGGEDPYFGTPFGSYDKAPEALQALGAPERGTLGRLYNIVQGTGVAQPLTSPIQTISNLMDDRRTLPETLVSSIAGPRIVPVDEDRALRQQLELRLRENPQIRQQRMFYETDKTEEGQALLKELRAVKSAEKKKRDAAAVL